MGPGSLAGWVRGWGLGGTPPGAVNSTLGRRGRFLRAKLFSDCPPPRAPPPLRAPAMRNIGRQIDVPAVGKFEISQMDAKSSLAPATALDDIASPNREPAGQVICERGHVKILLGSNNPRGTCRHQCQTSATVPRRRRVRPRFLWIAVDKRSGAQPRCTDLPCNTATWRRSQARLEPPAIKDRSRCPGPMP
jgi:hypothetical protein